MMKNNIEKWNATKKNALKYIIIIKHYAQSFLLHNSRIFNFDVLIYISWAHLK